MAERKASTVSKKVAATKATGKVAVKPKTAKAAAVATPVKAAASKAASPTAKPKNTKTPALKKTVAPVAEKKAPAKKAVTTKTMHAPKKAVAGPTPEERYRMVQTAAYFIAERNGFGGNSIDHWAAAEIEIAAKLGQ